VFSYRLRWDLVADNVGGLVSGLVILLQITALGFALAMILGLVVAVARTARSPLLRGPALAYTELMRGIPLFLFLFLVYYGAAQVSPVVLSPFVAAVLALGLTGSGYATEIYRGALQAVDPGQREAAFAMGLTPGQAFRDVVLPQALRIAVPPGMNRTPQGVDVRVGDRRGRRLLPVADRVAAVLRPLRDVHRVGADDHRRHAVPGRLRGAGGEALRPW
jgi:His/Glu/Gln/Arg/opine family amino acid ABC transporter permease subunit